MIKRTTGHMRPVQTLNSRHIQPSPRVILMIVMGPRLLPADSKDQSDCADVKNGFRLRWANISEVTLSPVCSSKAFTLILLLLNTTCPVLANSVDPDQLASEEAN